MYQGSPSQRYGHISYAQHGDDFFLANLFEIIGVERPSYLDIGAHHPFEISNTALLYKRGSRGVNVEANPNLIQAFKDHRPEDITVNVGVGPIPGVLPFFMHGPTAGRNTFDPDERDQWLSEGQALTETKQIKIVSINSIVEDYCNRKWPDLLTMDAEGLDIPILEDAQLYYNQPKVICVEVREKNIRQVKDLLSRRGYSCLIRLCQNLIFVQSHLTQHLR